MIRGHHYVDAAVDALGRECDALSHHHIHPVFFTFSINSTFMYLLLLPHDSTTTNMSHCLPVYPEVPSIPSANAVLTSRIHLQFKFTRDMTALCLQ